MQHGHGRGGYMNIDFIPRARVSSGWTSQREACRRVDWHKGVPYRTVRPCRQELIELGWLQGAGEGRRRVVLHHTRSDRFQSQLFYFSRALGTLSSSYFNRERASGEVGVHTIGASSISATNDDGFSRCAFVRGRSRSRPPAGREDFVGRAASKMCS